MDNANVSEVFVGAGLEVNTKCSFCKYNVLNAIICKSNNLTASYNGISRKKIAANKRRDWEKICEIFSQVHARVPNTINGPPSHKPT